MEQFPISESNTINVT